MPSSSSERSPSSAATTEAAADLATAARIAAALGRPTRSIRRALDRIEPDGHVPANGNLAAAWLFATLPSGMQLDLRAAAKRRGYASEEHLLKAPPATWLPPKPVSHLEAGAIKAAGYLQKALTPTLQRLPDIRIEIAEITSLGLADYRQVFGHGVTKRHFDRLVKRTLDRDGGAENWERLELFLPDRCPKAKPDALAVGFDDLWQPVITLIADFADQSKPSPEEICLFWDQAFACFESATEAGDSEKRVRRALRKLIETKIPFVRATGRALEAKIRRGLSRWKAGNRTAAALADRRADESGRSKAVELPKEFRGKMLSRAHVLNGRVAQAWRAAIDEGWMPPAVAAAYPFDWEHKSYVPAAVRRALAGDLKVLEPLRIGAHNAQMKGPSINRDYSNVPSGKIFQSDDITTPIWFYVTNPDGSFTMRRGQLLPWVCVRSHYIVTAQLIPEKGYDSIDILRGVARLHDEYGLPEQLYLENGTWATKLIDGSKGPSVPWKDFAYGLSGIGVRIRHAQPRNPRAKIVENIGGQLQNGMDRLRGYAGRSPDTCPEDTARNLKLVKAGKAHPSEYFYSHEECLGEIEKICERFNHEPQNGKMLNGLSPREAFMKFRESPPVKLPPELRYLIARSRVETTVKASGIHVNKFTYKGERASELVGQRVLAWFNADEPETICVTDLNHRNPITLLRESSVPAFDATPEEYEQANRENHAQTKYRRTLWTSLTKDFSEEFLRTKREVQWGSPDGARLGYAMAVGRAGTLHAATKSERLKKEENALSRQVGLGGSRQPIDEQRIEVLRDLAAAGIKATNPHSYEEDAP